MTERRIFCPMCLQEAKGSPWFVELWWEHIIMDSEVPPRYGFKHRFKACTGKWRIEKREVTKWVAA